ncbi:hypothetical protein AGABI2DRAFT_115753 [Agaricus bisporus var. bisporus H97]|uniref:hypothetical protein n=1 Tax=Agaricus bisporus var. bisporus (strain H97 / ATCC MYA-4626 / FGSC 10389) TaxID=936046 RepID=UPI00029F5E57|nr:hypothetical protein AGABI2DRAFT_115753 [Agaricus bisporus var. bisporus H97]EKV50691.1 hypothetical protein AGABI2DRAFT_115753 [Agaricus bisporus var. bisporus H97]
MRLILSSHDPRDSDYSTDAGQVIYKVNKSGPSVTTLRKAVNNDHFAQYAVVEFHTFRSTRFRFQNRDVSVEDHLRKEGWFSPRWVFRAADNREYYWKLDGSYLEMFRNDGSKKVVVRYREHKSSFGPFITGRPASLEVADTCVAILDDIIMTYIYCQQQRKQRQASINTGVNASTGVASGSSSGGCDGGGSC